MSDTNASGEDDRFEVRPTQAFERLTHETRMAAMRVLWEADQPLRFSEIVDRAGVDDTGNFNYHLGRLVGWFVRQEGEAYRLTRSGRQAMNAVLSRDLTDQPQFEPIRLENPCPYCGGDIALAHDGDKLRVLCTGCRGTYEGEEWNRDSDRPHPSGTITVLPFPANGVADRDPETLLSAGLTRIASLWQEAADGVCPNCGGVTTSTARACPDHDDGLCDACGSRFAGQCTIACSNCGQEHRGLFPLVALGEPAALSYFWDHGVDMQTPTWADVLRFLECDEWVHAADPVDAEVVWTLDGDQLTMRIGQGGTVDTVNRVP